jgi:hypothetical protein
MEVVLYNVAGSDTASQGIGYSHPTTFSVNDLKYILRSIGYQDKGLFGWTTPRAVFAANELYRIAPYLVEAFSKAKPGDDIAFSSEAAKSGGFFASSRVTSRRMFVKDKKLNCIFRDINIRADDAEDYGRDPRREYGGALTRLTTNDWQELVTGEKGVHYNWIEIEIEQAMAAKASSERAQRARTLRRRAVEQERERESVYWEDWEPDKALPPE